MKRGQPVHVEWEDSSTRDGPWRLISEVLKNRRIVRVTSVGYLVADDKRGVVLAHSTHFTEVAGVIHIPRGAIRKIRKLH